MAHSAADELARDIYEDPHKGPGTIRADDVYPGIRPLDPLPIVALHMLPPAVIHIVCYTT